MFLSSLLSAVYAVEKFEPIAKWLTIGVIAAVLLCGLIIFLVKRTAFAPVCKWLAFGLAAFLLVLAIVFFALDIAKNYSDSYAEENWLDKRILVRLVLLPLIVLTSVALCALTTFSIVAKCAPSKKKLVGLVGGILCALALLFVLICLALYYKEKIANDGYYNSDSATVKQVALYLSAGFTVVLIVGLTFIDKEKLGFNSRALAYAGICVAMSYALSYIKLWDMPAGGSVTLVSLFPVMLYAYIFGMKKGVFVGFVYGTLQALQDPWIIHPAQFLLDYPIAFSAVGLAGIFRSLHALRKAPQVKFALGACLAGTMRFVCHVLSGALAFEAYAEGQNVWAYSLGYNAYVFIDVALVVVAGIFVLSSKTFVKTLLSLQNSKTTPTESKN
ncbi:MAG: energy-coupled thiamine transporter ThiT [Clostridiales bacterium]|nr:energy-coupled thiamine transporter ThiT [Clostridiales bacterium]